MEVAEGLVLRRGRQSKKFACRRWRGRTGEKGGAAAGEGLADSACPECRDAIVHGTCVILRRHGDIDLVAGAEIEISCRLFTHARARSRTPRLDPVCGSPSYLSATRSHRRSWFVSSIQASPQDLLSTSHRLPPGLQSPHVNVCGRDCNVSTPTARLHR